MTRGRKAQESTITPIAVNEAAIAQDMAASAQLPAMESAIAEHQGATWLNTEMGFPTSDCAMSTSAVITWPAARRRLLKLGVASSS